MRLRQSLRELQPDVLHCWLYHACLIGALSKRSAGAPVIWGLRSANRGLREYSWRTRAVVRLCARFSGRADRIVVNSETSRQVHTEFGYAQSNMQIIRNGVDSGKFRPSLEARQAVRAELGLPSSAVLVGMVAGYRPTKDHGTFLSAARLVREKRSDVRFVLAGEGISSDNAMLRELLRRNGLEGASHLLGPRGDVERLTAALDIACLSSWSESFPNVIAEAMACEVPCVATNAGDAAEIMGDAGRVVPTQNPEALANGCIELLEMGGRKREDLGAKARQRVEEKFSVAGNRRSYETLYEEMSARVGVRRTGLAVSQGSASPAKAVESRSVCEKRS
jgi:glycosyltransferase involved in cell wall biosynthesis